jgi:glycosyltransferase involved in cell wall biosynthesis
VSRILLIPHAPATPLRTRAGELARALVAEGHVADVYLRHRQPPGLSGAEKALWHLEEAFGGIRRAAAPGGVALVTPPTVHRTGPIGNALGGAVDSLAAEWLRLAGRYDAVVSAAYGGLRGSRIRGARRVYDLVDDHAAGYRHAGRSEESPRVERYVEHELAASDAVCASSQVLVELARKRYGREARLVPNGADVAAIRAGAGTAPRSSGRRAGYAGGLDRFVRIDWVTGALERLRAGGLEAGLSVVGQGPAIEEWEPPAWVERLGFRPPEEIPRWLGRIDVGVVPFEVSPYTDAALPLKVLEYGAARRVCVSAPLEELRRQRFPWVIFAEAGELAWADALARAFETRWDPAWDEWVERFDWRVSARALLEVLR